METSRDGLHKVVILGTPRAGKTTLMAKLSNHNLDEEKIKSTIGVDFHVVQYEKDNIRLQVWDYAGQAHFRDAGIFQDMVQGASAFLFCYDTSNTTSIEEIESWVEIAKSHNRFTDTLRYLVGLKVDLTSKGQQIALNNLIQKYLGGEIIQKHFLVSSREELGIEIMTEQLVEDLKKLEKNHISKK